MCYHIRPQWSDTPETNSLKLIGFCACRALRGCVTAVIGGVLALTGDWSVMYASPQGRIIVESDALWPVTNPAGNRRRPRLSNCCQKPVTIEPTDWPSVGFRGGVRWGTEGEWGSLCVIGQRTCNSETLKKQTEEMKARRGEQRSAALLTFITLRIISHS